MNFGTFRALNNRKDRLVVHFSDYRDDRFDILPRERPRYVDVFNVSRRDLSGGGASRGPRQLTALGATHGAGQDSEGDVSCE